MRGQFLVDPDGIIQAMETFTPLVGRNIAESIIQVPTCPGHGGSNTIWLAARQNYPSAWT